MFRCFVLDALVASASPLNNMVYLFIFGEKKKQSGEIVEVIDRVVTLIYLHVITKFVEFVSCLVFVPASSLCLSSSLSSS